MAPTVYIDDLNSCDSPSGSESDSDRSDQDERPSFTLGFGVNSDMRGRRRAHYMGQRRTRRPLTGLAGPLPRRPTAREDEARGFLTSQSGVDDSENHLPVVSHNTLVNKSHDVNLKRWTSRENQPCGRRLLLLRRRGLLDISVRTFALLQRNQQLYVRLVALQAETREFVRSVLSNPENQGAKLRPVDEASVE